MSGTGTSSGTSIARILASKGHDVATTGRDAALREVVAALRERRVGALVVADGDDVVGIVSERDVVRALAEDGPDALDQRVEQVMTSPVTTCTPASTTDELMALMTDGRFRHLPVVDEGRLVGIVSIGDVVKWRLDELRTQAEALSGYVSGSY